jgi:trk system potassium uptake protein TrkH
MKYASVKGENKTLLGKFLNQTRTIILSFLVVILIGAGLLMLPFSHEGRLSFIDALFTATSATCVTGLSSIAISTDLTLFGQIITLLLVQIGGIGFMTLASAAFVIVGKKLSMRERLNMREYLAENDMSELSRLAINVIKFTLVIEGVGAVLLTAGFAFDYGFLRALYYGVFHSVMAFCNAGFDVIPLNESFAAYTYNPYILLVLSVLIILGGLGFIVIGDILKNRRWKKLRIDSKIVLFMSGILLLLGTILFMAFECNNESTMANMNFGHKLVNSLFMSTSLRTAGFATLAVDSFTPVSRNIMIVLMFIGASPGSTGGGIKTTTMFVLMVWIASHLRQKKTVVIGMRKVGNTVKSRAATILVLAVSVVTLAITAILAVEGNNFTFEQIMFETISAYATVGLTLSVTAKLGVISKIIIALVMFIGRVGVYTLFLAAIKKSSDSENIRYQELNLMM